VEMLGKKWIHFFDWIVAWGSELSKSSGLVIPESNLALIGHK